MGYRGLHMSQHVAGTLDDRKVNLVHLFLIPQQQAQIAQAVDQSGDPAALLEDLRDCVLCENLAIAPGDFQSETDVVPCFIRAERGQMIPNGDTLGELRNGFDAGLQFRLAHQHDRQ